MRVGLLVIGALALANAVWMRVPWIGIPTIAITLVLAARGFARRDSTAVGALRLTAALAIVSGALVLLGGYVFPARIALLACTIVAAWWGDRHRPLTVAELAAWGRRWIPALAVVAPAAIAAILILTDAGTTEPIRSPWSVVPLPFHVLVALLGIATTTLAYRARRTVAGPAIGVAVASTVATLVAILVTRIGFGFDHFIHAAAEQLLAATGQLHPRPFFYAGHYGLAVLLADATALPVAVADRLLVPLVTAMVVIPNVIAALARTLPLRIAALGSLALLTVPFFPLAVSTPQALANAFALTAIVRAMQGATRDGVLAAIAALLAQPMSGIIAAATVAGHILRTRGHPSLAAITTVLGALAIPAAFLLVPRIVGSIDIRFDPAMSAATALPDHLRSALTYAARDFATGDVLAIASRLLPLAWVACSLLGLRVLPRGVVRAPLLHGALAAFGAGAIIYATVSVPTQLPIEQTQFPVRLLGLAGILSIPLAAAGIGNMLAWVRASWARVATTLTVGVLTSFTLLLAYPRDDAQSRSGLWSVSASDIAAVHAIAQDAGDVPYVVLANQMLGAAAIREFGFQPSHTARDGRETLAFPLPAGGPIASAFWTFVDVTPVRGVVDGAIAYAGVNRAYVVIHDYWRSATSLVTHTEDIADAELFPRLAPDGSPRPITHVRIFRFDRR